MLQSVYWTYQAADEDEEATTETTETTEGDGTTETTEGEAAADDDGNGDFAQFGDFRAKLRQERITNNKEEECSLVSLVPETYTKSKRMGLYSACGYKF